MSLYVRMYFYIYMYVLYNIYLFYTEAFSNKMNPKNKASGGKQNLSITKEVHTAGIIS